MERLALQIFDETLRDGEQQAGLFLSVARKRELAGAIAATGVHRIDLMPAVDPSEAGLARALLDEGFADRLSAATLIGRAHVDRARALGLRRVILFYAVSDRLLLLRDPELRSDPAWRPRPPEEVPEPVVKRARDAMLGRVQDSVRHARAAGLAVDFAAEDASRADPDFLAHLVRALSPELDHFMVCDTVGALTPATTGPWIRELLDASSGAPLAVHFHDDQGLALENTLEAVLAGATMVSGTFRGIGERAGNVALESVLNGLRHRYGLLVDGIDYDAVERLVRTMDATGLRPAPPYSPGAFTHESGIHVQALLHDPRSYCLFPDVEPRVSFGKLSGASNFQYLFERVLGSPRPRAEYEALAKAIKRRSVAEGRCFSSEEVLALLADGSLEAARPPTLGAEAAWPARGA